MSAADARALGWHGPVSAPVAGATDIDVARAALIDARLTCAPERLAVLGTAQVGANAGALVARAITMLDARTADIVALVGRRHGDDATATVLLSSLAAARAAQHTVLAVVRDAIDRDAASGPPSDRFPMVAEACARRGLSPRSITLFDVHATDRARADAMLETVEFAMSRGANAPVHCTIAPLYGAVDGLTAVVALAVHVRALHTHVLPPLQIALPSSAPFGADPEPRPWIEHAPRRAAIWTDSSEGLSVVMLDSDEAPQRQRPVDRPLAPLRTSLTLVSAPDRAALIAQLGALAESAAALGEAPIDMRAAADTAPAGRFRAAMLASHGADLATKAQRLATAIADPSRHFYQTPDGLYFADSDTQPRGTAFLFPGQGSQYVGMFRALCLELPGIQGWFERLQDAMLDVDQFPPGLLLAPPRSGLDEAHRAALDRAMNGLGCGALLTLTASLALFERLQNAGLQPDAVAGYSNGENAAIVAAGFGMGDEETTFAFMNLIRLHDDNDAGHIRGVALAVNRAAPAAVADVLARARPDTLFLALDNCPEQVVLFGDPDAIAEADATLRAGGATCVPLAFEQGHHTPRFAGRARQLRALYEDVHIGKATVPVYSCASAAPFPADPVAARDLAADQWARRVRFTETIERLYADGIRCFVEVGAGSTLTGFVRSTLRGRPHIAVPANITGRPDLDQLLHLLGRLFVQGHAVNLRGFLASVTATEPAPAPASDPIAPAAPTPAPTAPLTPAPAFEPEPAVLAPVAAALPIADGRSSALFEQHQAMMREFLQSQQRAFDHLAHAMRAPQPSVAPVALPMATSMLGRVTHRTAERLEAVREFNRQHDVFVWHHAIGAALPERGMPHAGVPILPFTLSLELLAEAAAAFAGWTGGALTIESIRASQWIILDSDSVAVRIEASWSTMAEGAVDVRIFDEGGTRPVFQGLVRDGAAPCGSLRVQPTGTPMLNRESFTERLFHGPLFVSIDRFIAVDDRSIRAECVTPPHHGWFADDHPWIERVPCSLLDAASQLVGAWLAENGWRHYGLFPFEWKRYIQFTTPPAAGTRVILEGAVTVTGALTTSDIEVRALDGTRIARIEGLRGKVQPFPDPYYTMFFAHTTASRVSAPQGNGRRLTPFPPELVAEPDLWRRVLARQILNDAELDAWNRVPATEREPWLQQRIVAKEVALDALSARGLACRPRDLDSRPVATGFALTAPDGTVIVTHLATDAAGALTATRGEA